MASCEMNDIRYVIYYVGQWESSAIFYFTICACFPDWNVRPYREEVCLEGNYRI
jgi:hypothetical protein